MATTPTVGTREDVQNDSSSAVKPAQILSDVVEQRRISQEYMNSQIYGEWAEIYQSMKARVSPMMVQNEQGETVEDTSRTNVCMPDHFVMTRRKTARLTRNPPNLRVRGGPDQGTRDKAAVKLMYNWDRGHAQKQFRKITHSAVALGWGIGKNYWDKAVISRVFRRQTDRMSREDMLRLQEVPEEDIQAQIEAMGPQLSPEETAAMIQEHGPEATVSNPTVHYEGPVLESVFVGDIFPEPGFVSLNESAFIVENSVRDEDWLEYWTKQVTTNPETGEEQPVIDQQAAQELLDKAQNYSPQDQKTTNLRRLMRESVGWPDPKTSGRAVRPPRKKFMVDERHMLINGHYCVDYVAEETIYLGRAWYPWNTYGRSVYAEMVLIPDLVGGIGDSTPRISRYIHQLRNVRANQTTDFINNLLVPLLKMQERTDLTQKDLVRTSFGRIIKVKTMDQLQQFNDPSFPAAAWQDQAQLVRELQQIDPTAADFAPGTPTVPEPGRLATSLNLQAKASDNITADELTNQGEFVKSVCELWLWMDQQTMQNNASIDPTGIERLDAYTVRAEGGQPKMIEISPYDLQHDFEPLPEEGSTLASDDEYKVSALQQGIAIGERHPDIVNLRGLLTQLFKATPGISVETAILPPPQGPPPPPPPHVNITVAFKDLPVDAQAALLQLYNLPDAMAHVQGAMKVVQELGATADAAATLEAPVDYGGTAGTDVGRKKNAAGHTGKPAKNKRTS